MTDASAWNQIYAERGDKWTLEQVPAVLAQLIESRRERHRVLVPGAGHGHDAFAWARSGHEVVALDFAPLAVESMRQRASELGLGVEAIEADVTAPPEQLRGMIDLVWEQTY